MTVWIALAMRKWFFSVVYDHRLVAACGSHLPANYSELFP